MSGGGGNIDYRLEKQKEGEQKEIGKRKNG